MLAGVLLHVVKPACPINLALDCFPFDPSTGFILSSSASLTVNSVEGLRASFAKGRPFHLATYNVHYGPVMLPLEDIADGEAIEGALIVGLAAGGGIETGLVQNQPQPVAHSDPFEHLGLELLLINVIIVQPLGHLSISFFLRTCVVYFLRSGHPKNLVWSAQAIYIADTGFSEGQIGKILKTRNIRMEPEREA
jgi:hypothetical protein